VNGEDEVTLPKNPATSSIPTLSDEERLKIEKQMLEEQAELERFLVHTEVADEEA
jgi:hypothetical protein